MKLHIIKIMPIFLAVIFMMTLLCNCVIAAYDVTGQFSGESTQVSSAASSARTIVSTILDVVRLIGVAVALVILMYIGIKFMTAAPSERANIKQYSINYVVGACILLGASGILTVIRNFATTAITA